MRITKQCETDVMNANITLIESLRRTKDMRITNQCETARTGNITVMRIIVKNEDMRCMYAWMYGCTKSKYIFSIE